MYKVKGISDFLNVQDEECSCFGVAQQQDQHFLAKHKTASTTLHQVHPPNESISQGNCDISVKNGCKKSLKRQINAQNNQMVNASARYPLDDPSKSAMEKGAGRWWPEWQPHQVFNCGVNDKHKTQQIYHEITPHQQYSQLQTHPSHQFQYQIPQNHIAQNAYTQPQHPKFTFGTVFTDTTANCSPLTASPHKKSPSINELAPKKANQNENFGLNMFKKNQKSRQLQKSQSLQVIPNEYQADIDSLQLQRSIKNEQIPKSPRKEKDLLDAKLSPQSAKKLTSRLSLNIETGKSQLMNLKKMDDVMEICSQAGSQEDSDSDESIVLGRLNQYCSMMEPKGASTITAEKSVQSKAGGLTSISSTISHYHFNRKKDQL